MTLNQTCLFACADTAVDLWKDASAEHFKQNHPCAGVQNLYGHIEISHWLMHQLQHWSSSEVITNKA